MTIWRDAVYTTAAVLCSPVWVTRMLATGKWRTDWAGRFGHVHCEDQTRQTLLIHAVSVGEVNAIRLLVDQLAEQLGPAVRIVISTTTDTGFARAKQLFMPRHQVVRYPLDFTRCVWRFLNAVQPDAVALVELELWPNFVHECRRRQIPLAVINGRLSQRSFGRYRLIRPLVRSMFASLSFAAVQDEAYAERFIALGAPADRVHVTGTMKWDTASIADHVPGSAELAAAMGVDGDRPLIVCGSTGPGEEALMIEALGSLTDSSGRRVQLMIVPRKPERFEDVAEVLDQPTRRSACPDGTTRQPDDRGLFLLDTMGELRKAYALADVVVVGRSFSPQYGSDMMEPIALGKPTVIGPNTSDFADQMQRLLAGDGIIQVPDGSALRQAAEQLLGTERGVELAANGRNVILACQGATRRHAELLHAMLRDSGSSAVSAGHFAAVQGE